MRLIKNIIIHCSATEAGRNTTVDEIDQWHRSKGWGGIGYHYVVLLDGTIARGRPEDTIGAHTAGYNQYSIGVCYVGGLRRKHPHDTRTFEQKVALRHLLSDLKRRYPNARIRGHRDFNSSKACPSFDAKSEYSDL